MKRLFLPIFASVSFLLAILLLLQPTVKFRPMVNLPLGFQFTIQHVDSFPHLVFTHWKGESKEWYKSRPGLKAMNVTGETVALGNGQYGTKIHVEFATVERFGLWYHSGAVSRVPKAGSSGVMSTPLVPYRSVSFPWFYPIPLLLILPFLWLRRRLKHRRRIKANLCPKCGYDLRATPNHCPECGFTRPNVCRKCGYDLRTSPERCPECGLAAGAEL